MTGASFGLVERRAHRRVVGGTARAITPTVNRKAEVIRCLEDALRVLSLPDTEPGVRDDGKTGASYPFKCGYVQSSLKATLKELHALKVQP